METFLTPAHLHLAINHAPIIGLSIACLPLLAGILFKSRGAFVSGLLAVLLCVGTLPAIMETGESAQESFVDGSIEPGMDAPGKAAFREHSGRAKATAPVVYATGILALLTLIVLLRFPVQASWLGWSVVIGSLLSIALSVWTAEAGGRIRHTEFRTASPGTPAPAVPVNPPAPGRADVPLPMGPPVPVSVAVPVPEPGVIVPQAGASAAGVMGPGFPPAATPSP